MLFSTLHPLSLVIFVTAPVMAFILLRNSRFNFHCYTQHEATYSEISLGMMLQPLATSCTNDYKGHSLMKPASLNCPVVHQTSE